MNAALTTKRNGLPVLHGSDALDLYERFRGLISEVKDAQNDVNRITQQGFLGRFVSNVSGETSRAFAHAQDLQAQLQEAQVALAFVNLQLIGQLKEQQDTIDQQQRDLAKSNERLEKQQTEIQETTANVEKQQETILRLLNLSSDQEAQIREIVQTAGYVKNLEKLHGQQIDALSLEIRTSHIEFGEWVQRRLREEVEALTKSIDAVVTVQTEAQSEAEQRLAAYLNTEAAAREKAIQDTQERIEASIAAAQADLANTDTALQRSLQSLERDHNALHSSHIELSQKYARLIGEHSSTARLARHIGYVALLALLIAIVVFVISFA